MLQWMFFEQYSHEPYVAVARYWLKFAKPEELEKKRHLVPEWHAKGNAALGVMENHLQTHDWFAGNQYSIADIALVRLYPLRRRWRVRVGGFPAVSRWISRVAAQPEHIPLATAW